MRAAVLIAAVAVAGCSDLKPGYDRGDVAVARDVSDAVARDAVEIDAPVMDVVARDAVARDAVARDAPVMDAPVMDAGGSPDAGDARDVPADLGVIDAWDAGDGSDARDAEDVRDGIDAPDAGDAADVIDAPDAGDVVDVPDAVGVADMVDVADADGCAAGEVVCDGVCVDTETDPTSCGRCGRRCSARENASPACVSGACGIACEPGYGDCDRVSFTGCEVDLRSTSSHCGACGESCAGGQHLRSSRCVAGLCDCADGYSDCDGDRSNGCEVRTILCPRP